MLWRLAAACARSCRRCCGNSRRRMNRCGALNWQVRGQLRRYRVPVPRLSRAAELRQRRTASRPLSKKASSDQLPILELANCSCPLWKSAEQMTRLSRLGIRLSRRYKGKVHRKLRRKPVFSGRRSVMLPVACSLFADQSPNVTAVTTSSRLAIESVRIKTE